MHVCTPSNVCMYVCMYACMCIACVYAYFGSMFDAHGLRRGLVRLHGHAEDARHDDERALAVSYHCVSCCVVIMCSSYLLFMMSEP